MPRDGALTLSDIRGSTLAIVCGPCARRGRYAVTKLLEEHGDAKLTDLLVTLGRLPKRALPASTTGAGLFTMGLRLISAARLKALRGPGESFSGAFRNLSERKS